MDLKAGQVMWRGVNGIVRLFIRHVPETLTFRSLAHYNKAWEHSNTC